jgi:uncharacterized OsmC-like protein
VPDEQQQQLNGLDLGAVSAMVEAIGKSTQLAKARFKVSTRWTGQTRSETRVEAFTICGEEVACSHHIAADEPGLLFGGDTAPNPQQLLMAAFNACIMVGYVAGASLRGIELQSIDIDTHGELDLRGFLGLSNCVPPGHQAIDYEVRIKGNGTPEQFAEIHQVVMATSPNYFNMSRPIRMTGTLHTD